MVVTGTENIVVTGGDNDERHANRDNSARKRDERRDPDNYQTRNDNRARKRDERNDSGSYR